jgi:hypothetical protein
MGFGFAKDAIGSLNNNRNLLKERKKWQTSSRTSQRSGESQLNFDELRRWTEQRKSTARRLSISIFLSLIGMGILLMFAVRWL